MGKSYNPFKMWGSYVGAVLLFLSTLVFGMEYFNFYYQTIWQTWLHLPSISFSVLILTPILGFLLGYGIHALIRKLR